MYNKYYAEKLKERGNLGDLDIKMKIISKKDLTEMECENEEGIHSVQVM
jgi:hypothetical protein